jgi:DnaK suppressor protein
MPAKKPATKAGKSKKAAARKTPAASKTSTRKAPAKAKPKAKPAAKPKARSAAPKAKPKAKTKPAARSKTLAKTKTAAAKVSPKAVRAAAPRKASAASRKAPAKPKRAAVTAKTAPKAAASASAPRPKVARTARAVAMPSTGRRLETVVAEDEEGYDGEPRHNLLLGPRNVKPYIERRGEAYMSTEQLNHFRTILSSWKRDLMMEVDRTMTHMKDEAANPPDPNDRATLESEFALELRTRDRERKLIRKIDEALKRIEDGSYGYCLETGEPIGVKRLEARPVATLCIEAQERRERRERQYGDRDDWYR